MNELQLLKGSYISTSNGLKVYPLTISEITDLGDMIYNSYLSVTLMNKKVLDNLLNPETPKELIDKIYNLSDLDFILYLSVSMGDKSLLSTLIDGLACFLKTGVKFDEQLGIVINHNNEDIVLDNNTFIEIKKIVSKQNFLKESESNGYKPVNAKARALMEKLNKAKEKIQKQNNEEGLALHDIVSIVATYSNDISILTVWNLTVYQLYVCYLRLIVWDDYHNKQLLLPHVSDAKSLDMKHWATNINKLN